MAMSPIASVRRWIGSPVRAVARLMAGASSRASRRIRGRYDAAQHTEENRKHWGQSDWLSANGSNTHAVRWTLRNRSRYESANNSYCRGVIATIAHDTVGTGPRIQLSIPDGGGSPGYGRNAARQVERSFRAWCEAIDLADKLRVMEESRVRDGECFGLLVTNPKLHSVQLDLRLIEADQVTTPALVWTDPYQQDGVLYDKYGNPQEYHILKWHPGDVLWRSTWEYDRINASHVLHWYRPQRPGQARGIPEITPALPLFAQLRRYTLATIAAAEVAAMLAGVMKTNQPADGNGAVAVEAMDQIELVKGALLTLPEGWEAQQFDAKQPVSTYKEFKGEILAEVGRSVNLPANAVKGTNQDSNYSSARLDNEIYHRSIRMNRHQMRRRVLDRLFRAWLAEAVLIPGLLPAELPPVPAWSWSWYWDGFGSADPQKDANANVTLLASNLTTLAELYAEDGKDWEDAIRQRSRERQLLAELGLSEGEAVPQTRSQPKQQSLDDLSESQQDQRPENAAQPA